MQLFISPPPQVISIHALLAESDYLTNYHFTGIFIFLSTLSLRRATGTGFLQALLTHFYPRSPCGERLNAIIHLSTPTSHFYPRSPCGERRTISDGLYPATAISIHALLAESDKIVWSRLYFKSLISIHALLAESDLLD